MATTIKTTVNGKAAELLFGGKAWPVSVAGTTGHWDASLGCVMGCDAIESDQERAVLSEKFRNALRTLLNTRPSLRPAVLEVA